MKSPQLSQTLFAGCMLATACIMASNVKVTPLGSHDSEFYRLDRALIFENPDGTRLLCDTGRTFAGPEDPRLGRIDALLVNHMSGDHVSDRHQPQTNAGECGNSNFSIGTAPDTNTGNIALAKIANIVIGDEMPRFFASKLKARAGDPKASQLVRFGATEKVGGVSLTTVSAMHSNGISGTFIGGQLGEMLNAAELTSYAGPPTSYVLTFSNGLVVYLSGITTAQSLS